jgi:hypothetical protein
MSRILLPFVLAASFGASPLAAKPLVVGTGESWIFTIERGQPARARRVAPSTKPGKGEVHVSVRSMLGTMMTIASNNPVAYTFRAELLGTKGPGTVRACTLPANGRPALESWPKAANGVRISDFKPATAGGSCP